MLRWRWHFPVWIGIIGILVCSFFICQHGREVPVSENTVTYHIPKQTGNVQVKTGGIRFNKEVNDIPAEPETSDTSVSESLEVFSDDSELYLELEDDVSKVQHEIAEFRVNSNIETSEPQIHQTIRDLCHSVGLSESALAELMTFIPIDPSIRFDQIDDLLANMQAVSNAFDHHLKTLAATLTLDEAREMVGMFKDYPTMTEDEYRFFTREFFSTEIQRVLEEDGVL